MAESFNVREVPCLSTRGGRRARFRRGRRGAARRPWTLLLASLLSAEIVIWAGIATDWFWWGPAPGTSGSSGGGHAGYNPNPYNESISEVIGGIDYLGGPGGYFPALEEKNICGHCPARPIVDSNYTPAQAGFWFYFNVTNNGSSWETISNFSISTSGSNPGLFKPGWVACCYPNYAQTTVTVGFASNQTWSLAAFVLAPSLADVGPSGYVLYFNVTSP